MTIHSELKPQDPGQGSLHLSFMHARLAGQSDWITHSGRQFGGRPIYSFKQEHTGWLLISRHCENCPQGLGIHGWVGSLYSGVSKYKDTIRFGKQNRLEKGLRWIKMHLINGSPSWSLGQLHIGLWLTTWQLAWKPQGFAVVHGSTHFWPTHALSWGHSELTKHSARQLGGLPI